MTIISSRWDFFFFLGRDGIPIDFFERFFFFSSSDARQVTLLSDLDGEKLCRNIRYWRYIYIYMSDISRIFVTLRQRYYTSFDEHIVSRSNFLIFISLHSSFWLMRFRGNIYCGNEFFFFFLFLLSRWLMHLGKSVI